MLNHLACIVRIILNSSSLQLSLKVLVIPWPKKRTFEGGICGVQLGVPHEANVVPFFDNVVP